LLPFSYQKQGKTHHIHYYQCPEEALEDEDVMRIWAVNAYQVALTAQSLKSVSLFDD
jgi:TfoX/Sxy family transcriptional regulator of competence genes